MTPREAHVDQRCSLDAYRVRKSKLDGCTDSLIFSPPYLNNEMRSVAI